MTDPALCKDLSDNRDRYIEQSKRTRHGQVAELPDRPHLRLVPKTLDETPGYEEHA